jgi:Dehydrogenases with different specificities (related to short-chain alcohol dehydrogenases)
MNWTTEEIEDLENEKIIVTGANSGLGFSASKYLAENGAQVIMACRSPEKGEKARNKIEDKLESPSLEVMELDLSDLGSVEAFGENFRQKYSRLDVLCNNAGLMALPRRETEDGFEMQLGVNHLGHFALTSHLIDMIIESKGRVVNQSSMAHEDGEIDFDDLMGEKDYSKWGAYGQSKLANLLFTYELDRRLKEKDIDVQSVACHPGVSDTNLFKIGPKMEHSKIKLYLGKIFSTVLGQSPDKGCLPMLYAATSGNIQGGEYIGPDGFKTMRGYPEKQESTEASKDEEKAKRIWKRSEELTGVKFSISK